MVLFRCSNEYNVKMKKVFLVIVINVRGTYNRNYREVKFIKVLKKQILDFLESVQIVDKTTKISMNVLMFWSFFKKISHMAEYQ